MRRTSAEEEIRLLIRWLAIGLGLLGCCLLVALPLVQYRVEVAALYDQASGTVYVDEGRDQERRIQAQDVPYRINVGNHLRMDAEAQGRVEILRQSRAYAYLLPGADWVVLEASRQGTFLQHLQGQSHSYQLIIQQEAGVVLYDFSQSTTPLADLNLILRFTDGEYTPTTVCFQATAPTPREASAVVEVPCRSGLEVTPAQPLTLP
jgi:hypothetical protein